MAIEFENPLTAGTVLVREQIQSQNYTPGSAGWVIRQDGYAEFNNIVIRGGTVVSGIALYYNGTPALGNLILSIAATAGTDAFGNTYVKGLGVYGSSGTITATSSNGSTTTISGNGPGGGVLSSFPALEMQPVTNTGDPALVGGLDTGAGDLMLLMTSPSPVVGGLPGTDYSQIAMVGPYNGNPPYMTFTASAPGSVISFNNGLTINSSGLITDYENNTYASWTPTITNGGTLTLSQATGWRTRIGNNVLFGFAITVGTAGSGATNIMMSAPLSIDRTIRQSMAVYFDLMGATHSGSGILASVTTGSGATWDRVRNKANTPLTGADLVAGAIITGTGFYRSDAF